MMRMLLTLGLAAYNNLANLWPPFNRRAYVPVNLFATVALGWVAFGPLGLAFDDVVGSIEIVDAFAGMAMGALVAAPLFVGLRSPRWRVRIADERTAHLSGAALAYRCLVHVPLGTALLEEFAFRGVLFVAWDATESTLAAAILSSAVFGLWHVAPARNAFLLNHPASSMGAMLRWIALTVAGTFAAGLILVWLRVLREGVLLPFALHATLNSLATLAGARAHPPGHPRLAGPVDGGDSIDAA